MRNSSPAPATECVALPDGYEARVQVSDAGVEALVLYRNLPHPICGASSRFLDFLIARSATVPWKALKLLVSARAIQLSEASA